MRNDRYAEIDGVIAYIHERICDPLSLAQLASYAGYSPFHFARVFKERVGLSPQYYVSSLRLQKAKDLLLHTDLRVRDIGMEIGQQSLGTFTTRFTERVGVSPSDFRNSRLQAEQHIRSLQQLEHWLAADPSADPCAAVEGTVRSEVPVDGVILVGLFAKPIPEGLPIHGTLLASPGDFCFTDVKPGTYYLMATSVTWGMKAVDVLPHSTLRARAKEPIVVTSHAAVPRQRITLHPPKLDDPPILVSLPLLMNHFLRRVKEIQA